MHPHTVPALRLAPTAQLVVEIWDWDRFTTNEKMATLRLSLKPHFLVPRERAGDPAALQKPVWYPVASTTDAGVGATMQGELLLSFQLVPKNSEKDVPPPVPSIRVRCRCLLAARCWLWSTASLCSHCSCVRLDLSRPCVGRMWTFWRWVYGASQRITTCLS